MFELTPLICKCCLSSILLDQTCQRLLPAVEVASMGECDNVGGVNLKPTSSCHILSLVLMFCVYCLGPERRALIDVHWCIYTTRANSCSFGLCMNIIKS